MKKLLATFAIAFAFVTSAAQAAPTVMDFNSGFADPYIEDGFRVQSWFGGSPAGGGHTHPTGSSMFNHAGGCCSSPYRIDRVDGGTFSFTGFDQLYGTDFVLTGSNGASIVVTSMTGYFALGSIFSNVTWVDWNVEIPVDGSAEWDNAYFDDAVGVPAPGALALLGLGLFGLGAARRRKAA